MLTVFRDDAGHLTAACDWSLVDPTGQVSPSGVTVWVEQFEVSAGENARVHLRNTIADILWRAPTAYGAYWVRRDADGGKKTHWYTRARLTAYLHKEMGVMV